HGSNGGQWPVEQTVNSQEGRARFEPIRVQSKRWRWSGSVMDPGNKSSSALTGCGEKQFRNFSEEIFEDLGRKFGYRPPQDASGQSSVDIESSLQHPRRVLRSLSRVAALAMVIVLVGGHLAECQGWLSTAEARMACCANEQECPMHKAGQHS